MYFRARKWDRGGHSPSSSSYYPANLPHGLPNRKGDNGLANPAFLPDTAGGSGQQRLDCDHDRVTGYAPDPTKCKHFDGSFCHKMAVIY